MDSSELRSIGLSDSEAVLYLALVRVGASDVQTLIEETGFYKSNAYDALERLCEKGIISKIVESNKRFYQLQKPEALIEYIAKKKLRLEQQEVIARRLATEVELAKKHLHVAETAMVFKGLSGVRQIYNEIIEKKLDYVVFGSPGESGIMGDHYWQNLHAKQVEYNVKAKMIFHKSLNRWQSNIPKSVIMLKFLDEEFEPLTETTVYGSKIAFVVWTEKPIVTIINNEHVAQSYRQVFQRLWSSIK